MPCGHGIRDVEIEVPGRTAERAFHLVSDGFGFTVGDRDQDAREKLSAAGGDAVLEDGVPTALAAGDIALITGVGSYTVADDPATVPEFVIRDGRPVELQGLSAPRTYGGNLAGSTIMIRGGCELRGDVGERLLSLLPASAVIPADPRTRPALDMVTAEVSREEPGQDAVLHRLLDFVLVLALRAWCARPEANLPPWYRALTTPAIGEALRLIHADPGHRWTVAELATKVGLSRATFADRFAKRVGQPPLGYLTSWRMTLAADLLRDTTATIAAVARQVGYEDPFAFSVAFKRAYGCSPSAWRRGVDLVGI
jgi:AraC-like DNA-binding protein